MEQITTTEKRILNHVSMQRNLDVKLGDILSNIIREGIAEGTPVNAVKASAILDITGVVTDGELLMIGSSVFDEPIVSDVYEFAADSAQTVESGHIPVDIEAYTTKATVTLTMDTQPTSGDKLTIGEKTYTFVPVGTDTADGEVSIGADLASAQVNLVDAINGGDDFNLPHPLVSAADFVNDECVITALIGGTVANSIETTAVFTAETNEFADDTLLTGTDCSAANAVTALVAAITASDTQGVGAADGVGNTVVFTADVAGAAANAIELAIDLENAQFTGGLLDTTLQGGIDGTNPNGKTIMFDDTYLYVCIDGANWRRVALGNAF